MTAVEVTNAICALHPKVVELEKHRAQYGEALEHALGVPPSRFNEQEVRELRRQNSLVEERLVDLKARIDALKAQSPTADKILKAENDARALAEEVGVANERFVAAWPRFTDALAETERIAREVLSIRREAETAAGKLKGLVGEFGFDASIIPHASKPSPADDKVTYLVGIFLEQLADGFGASGEPSGGAVSTRQGPRREAARRDLKGRSSLRKEPRAKRRDDAPARLDEALLEA